MIKKDKLFYTASTISALGVIAAAAGYNLAILLFIAAYLLRPTLHEFGLATQYADERQLVIHSRSGNLAFIIVMLGIVGMVFWRIADGQQPDELYTLLIIGLAGRSLTGLVIAGEYRKAGVVILTAIGILLGLFIILDSGFSGVSIVGIVVALLFYGFGQLARKFPKTISIGLAAIVIIIIFANNMFRFHRVDMAMWMFFVAPILLASICLFLGGKEEEVVSSKARSIVFGSYGAVAAVVFSMLLIVGSSDEQTHGASVIIPEGEITIIQGIPCTGNIEYYKDGTLAFCVLAREDTLSGQPLPAGTGVHFDKDSLLDWCFLEANTEIQGIITNGHGHDFMTAFHPNGQLRTAYLVEDQLINGIPVSKFSFISVIVGIFNGKTGETTFYENGQLKYCELSKNFTIDDNNFHRGDVVWFDSVGNLIVEE